VSPGVASPVGAERSGRRVRSGVPDRLGGGFAQDEDPQDVQDVDVGVPVVDRVLCGFGEHLVGATAEQPGDVDRAPSGDCALLTLQVAGDELVERTVAGISGTEECRHETSWC